MSNLIQGSSKESFLRYNDQDGNELVSLNKDGSVFSQGIRFADGTFQSTAGNPALPDMSVQFNNNGTFGGSPNFTYGSNKVSLKGATSLAINGNGTTLVGYLPVEIHSVDGGAGSVAALAHTPTPSSAMNLDILRSRGTCNSPLAVQSEDVLGRIQIGGYDGTDYFYGVNIQENATENWTSLAHGARINFYSTANGQTGLGIVMRLDQDQSTNVNTVKPFLDNQSDLGTSSLNWRNGFFKGTLKMAYANVSSLAIFANNAAAITGGLVAGDFYRTGADPDLVAVVH